MASGRPPVLIRAGSIPYKTRSPTDHKAGCVWTSFLEGSGRFLRPCMHSVTLTRHCAVADSVLPELQTSDPDSIACFCLLSFDCQRFKQMPHNLQQPPHQAPLQHLLATGPAADSYALPLSVRDCIIAASEGFHAGAFTQCT